MSDLFTTHQSLPCAEELEKCCCLWGCGSPPSPTGIFSNKSWARAVPFQWTHTMNVFFFHPITYFHEACKNLLSWRLSHLSGLVIISQQMKNLRGWRTQSHTPIYTRAHTHKHCHGLSLISLGNQIKNSIDVNNKVFISLEISVPFKPILPVRGTAEFSTGTRPDR